MTVKGGLRMRHLSIDAQPWDRTPQRLGRSIVESASCQYNGFFMTACMSFAEERFIALFYCVISLSFLVDA